MDNFTPDTELLITYLDGELDENQRKELEARLSINTALANELENLKAARDSIKLFGLQNEIAAVHTRMMKEIRHHAVVRPMTGTRKILRYSLSAAAGLLIFFIGLQVYRFASLSPEKLYREQYMGFELSTTRGSSQTGSSIDSAFKAKNFALVNQLVGSKDSKSPDEEFLAGVSSMETNNFPAAIQWFEKAVATAKDPSKFVYHDEAQFYLVLAYTKNRNYEKAIDLATTIRNDPEHLYNKKFSRAFVRQLNWLKYKR